MSEITLFKRWTVKRKFLWIALGSIPVLCIVIFGAAALFTPSYLSYDMAPSYGGYGGGDAASGMYYPEAAQEAFAADDSMDYEYAQKSPSLGDTTTVSAISAAAAERLIIREGNISVYVEKTRQTRDDIEALVASFVEDGGYVISATESSRGEGKEPYISMAIRVPVSQFDHVMDAIAEMAVEVLNSNQNAQDVTEEYVDLQGRIEALEASRNRLMELMENAEFTEDLLRAEQELTVREAELESFYGRLNYLTQSARLSRIYIDLQPYELYEPIDTRWKPAETFRHAVEDLIDSMQGFADFMITFGIAVLPWLVFFGLIIWGVVAIVRRVRRGKQPEA